MNHMQTSEYSLMNRPEYFRDLARVIAETQPGDRVALASMTFDSREPLIHDIVAELCKAASRGVHTHLVIDAHSFLAQDGKIVPGPLWSHTALPHDLKEPFRGWLAALRQLEASGGHYAITNIPSRPFTNPYGGRSHIKGAVVNNRVYIGGCNLQNPEHIDLMLVRTHAESADWLHEWLVRLCSSASTQHTFQGIDQHKTFRDGSEILIDSGIQNQSAIYDRALQLIDQAQRRIYLTCQYFPGGPTAQHLLQAQKRGVDVQILFSPASTTGQKKLAHMLHIARERMRMPSSFFAGQLPEGAPKLHAKVLITDNASLIGSHNYVPQGVNFGTAEIALQNNDPVLAEAVIRKISSQLPL